MDAEFIDLTPENIEDEHLCCIIRTKKGHPGIEAKRAWLKERLSEGHVFRKLNVKGCAFIEYAHWRRHGCRSSATTSIIYTAFGCRANPKGMAMDAR